MSLIAWILLGLVSGFIGSRIAGRPGRGFFGDVVVGLVGSFLGGAIFNFCGAQGVTGFNLWSILVSAAGSAVLLTAYYSLRGAR